MRKLLFLIVLAVGFVIAWLIAGRGAGPEIERYWSLDLAAVLR